MSRYTIGGAGGLILNRRGAQGFVLSPGGVKGWRDRTGTKGEQISRPNAHGDYDLPIFRTGRIVSLSGTFLGETPEKLEHAGDRFAGLGAGGSVVRFVAEESSRTLWADGRVIDSGDWDEYSDGVSASFMLSLRFANPRKFGETHTFASGSPAYHFGNFPASPIFTIAGTRPTGYSIADGIGGVVTITRALAAGSPHTYDAATGLLRVAGVVVKGGVTRADRLTVPPGTTRSFTVTGAGASSDSIRVVDTFI
jgi:hypothetical protein